MKSQPMPPTIEELRVQLVDAQRESEPNFDAPDVATEAVRVNAARTRAEIIAGRLQQAEEAVRQARIRELRAAMHKAKEKHDQLISEAYKADREALLVALGLFDLDFRGRIELAAQNAISVEGRKLRNQAAAAQGEFDELETEFRQVSR